MYAVVEIAGKQIRVCPDQDLAVPRLAAEVGTTVTFERVFAVRSNGGFHLGSPTVEGARVVAEVISHGRGEKVTVFKFKRRKFYRRKRGHRQPFTRVRISDIVV
jgi:large subunit ribosomal protein L21